MMGGAWQKFKFIWKICSWCVTHPIKTLLLIFLGVLLFLGIVHSVKQLFKPSLWGFGKGKKKSSKPQWSLYSLFAVLLMFLGAILTISFSLLTWTQITIVTSELKTAERGVDKVAHLITDRAKELQRSLDAINDQMVDGYWEVLGSQGKRAANLYADELSNNMEAIRQVKLLCKRYKHIKSSITIFNMKSRRNNHRKWKPIIDRHYGLLMMADGLEAIVEEIYEHLVRGEVELKEYVDAVLRYLPDLEKDKREIKKAIEKDIEESIEKGSVGGEDGLIQQPIAHISTAHLDQFSSWVHGETTERLSLLMQGFEGRWWLFVLISALVPMLVICSVIFKMIDYSKCGILVCFCFALLVACCLWGGHVVNDFEAKICHFCGKDSFQSQSNQNAFIKIANNQLSINALQWKELEKTAEKTGNIFYALKRIWGKQTQRGGTLFNKKLKLASQMAIISIDRIPSSSIPARLRKKNQKIPKKQKAKQEIAIPYDNLQIGIYYQRQHRRVIQAIGSSSSKLNRLLEKYEESAKLAKKHAHIPLPANWQKLIESCIKSSSTLEYMISKIESTDDVKILNGYLLAAKDIVGGVEGVTGTIKSINELLHSSVKSQFAAIATLKETSAKPSRLQRRRLDLIESKTNRMLRPILDPLPIIKQVNQTRSQFCSNSQRNDINQDFSKEMPYFAFRALLWWILIGLLMCVVGALMISNVFSLLFGGLTMIFPCLEIVNGMVEG